ncbi:MAG: phospholipid carrier-dependent glycosyltransferase [Candidatus Peregrinibacteria bacterium]
MMTSLILRIRNIHPRWFVGAFFALYFFVGVASFRSFGIAVDEGTMDSLGRDVFRYVFLGTDWPTNEGWRFHGTSVELPIYIVQQFFFPGEHPATEYLHVYIQHFVVFLITFFGVVMLYLLARRHFRSSWWALLCCLLFVLTPRLFAQSFYNSRDLPMLAFFTASMFSLVRFAERPTVGRMLLHSVFSALALALRMPALIIPVITVLYFFLHTVTQQQGHLSSDRFRQCVLLVLYFLSLAFATIVFWPFLWDQPLAHFLEAYRYMGHINGSAMFLGHLYANIPWFYIPVWITATVPLMYTVFFLLGCFSLCIAFLMHPRRWFTEHSDALLFLGWFFLPIFSIIITGAGIYNEWRHVFFIYPAFLLLAVTGIRSGLSRAKVLGGLWSTVLATAIIVAISGQILSTGIWMVRNHPFQFAYFSLPSSFVSGLVPYDYWKLSYRDAMRFVLAQNPGIISVYSNANVAYMNAYNVFPESLSRIMRVPKIAEAMYVVTDDPALAPGLLLLHEVNVDGLYLSGVYKGPMNSVLVDPVTKGVFFR